MPILSNDALKSANKGSMGYGVMNKVIGYHCIIQQRGPTIRMIICRIWEQVCICSGQYDQDSHVVSARASAIRDPNRQMYTRHCQLCRWASTTSLLPPAPFSDRSKAPPSVEVAI